MIDKKPNNGPTFPNRNNHNDGMTLRQYYAAKALQAMLSNSESFETIAPTVKERGISNGELLAEYAFCYADYMIAAEEK